MISALDQFFQMDNELFRRGFGDRSESDRLAAALVFEPLDAIRNSAVSVFFNEACHDLRFLG